MRSNLAIVFGLIIFMISNVSAQDNLRMNDIQVIGSHNSYKKPIDPALMQYLYSVDSNLAVSLDYAHLSLTEQLNMGIRSLELDVYHDPEGGKYANPIGLKLLDSLGLPHEYFDKSKQERPGLKVFHVQEIDFRSHNATFKGALEEILLWSENHQNHIPLIITLNAKDEIISWPGFQKPLPFTAAALDSIDLEIQQVLPKEKLITPDFVRGKSKSLETAILKKGWPELSKVRGKIMFVLDESHKKIDDYLINHYALKGRIMFVNSPPGNPESGFLIMNQPLILSDKIKKMVSLGYMVRTRSDANTIEARTNDYTRWEKAIDSGAQVISTDYYVPSIYFESAYKVQFEGSKVFIKNVNAPR